MFNFIYLKRHTIQSVIGIRNNNAKVIHLNQAIPTLLLMWLQPFNYSKKKKKEKKEN